LLLIRCEDTYVRVCMIVQLRDFLHRNHHRLGNVKLMLYCYQLSCAMTYLDSKKFVHRYFTSEDVASPCADMYAAICLVVLCRTRPLRCP